MTLSIGSFWQVRTSKLHLVLILSLLPARKRFQSAANVTLCTCLTGKACLVAEVCPGFEH